jgi:hypothetical protein
MIRCNILIFSLPFETEVADMLQGTLGKNGSKQETILLLSNFLVPCLK